MRLLRYATLLAACVVASAGCSGKNAGAEPAQGNAPKGKVLIVYFSHAGENYAVGNVKVGNTKIVADEVRRLTGGDVFEIVAEKSYDMPYDKLTRVAKEEAEKGELPAFKGKVDSIARYDTVFIGGPVWWGTYPRVMFSFFKKYDLNGKTIIPFTTHEGSGLGSVVEDLKKQYPRATVSKGFSMYGHDVRTGKEKIDKWLKGLGY